MIIPLSLKIAINFIRGCRKGNIISLVSAISIISISLGVGVLIIGLSIMNGFERELNQRILAVVPHGEIEPITPPFSNWKNIIKRIKKIPGISTAAPYIHFTGLIEFSGKWQVIQIKGVDPEQENRLNALSKFVKNNDWKNFITGKHKIIIGQGLSKMIQAVQGDWITIIFSDDNFKTKLMRPKKIRLQISGILALNSQLDNNLAIIPLADSQVYLNKGQDIGGISIKVTNLFHANRLVCEAGKSTNTSVYIRSWMSTYGYMYRDIQMIRMIVYFTMTLVIIIAYFNIISTLITAVNDKFSDIAILCSLGAKKKLIHAIFIWYGLLTSFIGNLIGIVIGILVSFNLTTLIKQLENFFGYQFMSNNIYFINFLPTEIHYKDIGNVLVMALFFSLLASWYPAKRSMKINLVRILNRR